MVAPLVTPESIVWTTDAGYLFDLNLLFSRVARGTSVGLCRGGSDAEHCDRSGERSQKETAYIDLPFHYVFLLGLSADSFRAQTGKIASTSGAFISRFRYFNRSKRSDQAVDQLDG